MRISTVRLRIEGYQNVDQLSNLDHVATNANSTPRKAQLYIFEGSEAVITVLIKERSPMMKMVSRTHRVAMDWLFDRINLDPEIQANMLTPKTQPADMLTKGSFTRDEWCDLLRLCNIMIFSRFSRSHVRSVEKATTMSKRIQERKTEGEPAVAKPRSV